MNKRVEKIYSRKRIRLPPIFLPRIQTSEKNIKKRKFIKVFIIILIAFGTIKIVLNAIFPIFNTLCKEEAKSIATIVANEEASSVMSKHTYDELYTIEKDKDGNIKMINSNVAPMNEIMSDIAVRIQSKLNQKGRDNIEIALGSFTGFKLFAGKGPGIPITISTMGNIDTDLKSEFREEGINQTLHRVYLEVVCEISILTPYEDITEKITNQVLIAENVILGEIPSTYYNLEGLGEDDMMEVMQ